MADHIDFYFDFSSSYTCIALARIEDIAARYHMSLRWMPIALGAIFKERGHAPPAADTVKGRYVFTDVERCAAEQGINWRWPDPFPFNSIPAARGFLWVQSTAPDLAPPFARLVFASAFTAGRGMSSVEELGRVAEEVGLDPAALAAGIQSAEIKTRLVQQTGEAAKRGVFGAPTLFAGDEMFWGADRLYQLEAHLAGGR